MMGWQVRAVRDALEKAGRNYASVTVEPVLCFIDGEWPFFGAPKNYRGVHIEGPGSIKRLVTRRVALIRQRSAT
ncbi:MAG: hypothetical protein NVSMB2_13640 [Chloroflexota bacterium]